MKKLMIAAAAAAMVGGAYAAFCDDEPAAAPETCDCFVYDVKLKVKTLAPKAITVKEEFDCEDDESYCIAYYKSATRTFDGLLWNCCGACEDFEGGDYNIVMWEKKQKQAVLGLYDAAAKGSTEQMSFDLLNRFDKKADKVQAAAVLPLEIGDVTIAGFGSFDKKKGYVKSIKGNAAGAIAPVIIESKNCNDCDNLVVDLCTEFEDYRDDGVDADLAAASGTWSIKYNKSLSTGKKRAGQVIPAYAHE